MKAYLTILFAVALSAIPSHGQGTMLWDESVNGPLSNNGNNPTSLTPLRSGTNTIIGAIELQPTPPNYAAYPDYFLVHIPSNETVTAIYLQIDKPNGWAWFGDPGFGNMLGFTRNSTSGDLLPQWGLNPVSSGDYGMYMLNNDAQPILSIANYRLDFFVQAVPEPSTFWLFFIGAGCVVGLRCLGRLRRAPR